VISSTIPKHEQRCITYGAMQRSTYVGGRARGAEEMIVSHVSHESSIIASFRRSLEFDMATWTMRFGLDS
jgi:hypothetical protein